MRNLMKSMIIMATLLISSMVLAQGRFGGQLAQNEDLQFIREWKRSQTIAELADALALTQDQVDTLNAVKADLDSVQADFEPQLQAAIDELAIAAATVRANIVATNELTEADEAVIKEARQNISAIMREQRATAAPIAAGLEGLLTDEQRAAMAAILRPDRDEGDGPGARGQRGRGPGKTEGAGRGGRSGNRGSRAAVRILLSDEFLSHYNS